MYIFSRTATAALGRQADALPAAVAIATKATQITGHPIQVFSVQFGAPSGTVMWTTTVESHAERQDLNEKLLADPGYVAAVGELSGLFMTPGEDRFSRVLTSPIEPTSSLYGVTQAAMTDGKFAEAIAFGIEIAEYVGAALDMPTAFTKAEYGGFADVSWVLGMDSAADLDSYADWQMTDAGYQERVTGAAGLFVEGSGMTSLVAKVG